MSKIAEIKYPNSYADHLGMHEEVEHSCPPDENVATGVSPLLKFRVIKLKFDSPLFVLSALVALCLFGCKGEPPVPKMKLVEGAGNLVANDTADFGGILSQSFKPVISGHGVSIRLLIEGKENPRDLLAVIRKADANGYPTGDVLTSGLATIPVSLDGEAHWQEIHFNKPYKFSHEANYTFEAIPSAPDESFGYFEYSYSTGNAYPPGRLHPNQPSRRVPEDVGKDLCFRLITEIEQSQPGEPVGPVTQESITVTAAPFVPETPLAAARQPNVEFDRFLRFLRMHRLNFNGYSGLRVQVWASLGNKATETIVDETIPQGSYDIFYGNGDNEGPFFHLVESDQGGGTRYLPRIGTVHFYPDISLEAAIGRSVVIGKEYSGEHRIWLLINKPEIGDK